MGTILYNAALPTTDATLTTASSSATVSRAFAVNTSGAAVTVTLTAHRSISGSVDTIVNGVSVPANSAAELLYNPQLALSEVVLEPGDSLHGSASASGVTLTLTA